MSGCEPQASPWFVYSGDDRVNLEFHEEGSPFTGSLELFGARENALGHVENVLISGDAVRKGELGSGGFLWSPDGRYLVFTVHQDILWYDPYAPMHAHWLAMGEDGPGKPALLPDVPFQPELERMAFSADSKRLLTVGREGLYLTRFGSDGPEPASTVETPAAPKDAWFCADPRFAFVDPWDGLMAIVDLDGKGKPKTIPYDATPSRDKRWLFFQNSAGTHLIPCSTESRLTYPELEEGLTGSAAWSPDSRYLAYRDNDGALTLSRAQEGTQRALWQSSTARAGTFAPNSQSYIYGEPRGDSVVWHMLDLTDDRAEEQKRTLSFAADRVYWRGERLFFARHDPASTSDPPQGELWVTELPGLAQPRLVARDVAWSTGRYEPSRNLFVHAAHPASGAELWAYDLALEPNEPRALLGKGFLGDLSIVTGMPSGRGLIVGHQVMRATAIDELWMVPYEPTAGEPVRINSGGTIYLREDTGCPNCSPKFQPQP
jgi:hypothetical protein